MVRVTLNAIFSPPMGGFLVRVVIPDQDVDHITFLEVKGFEKFVIDFGDPFEVGDVKVEIGDITGVAKYRKYLEEVWDGYIRWEEKVQGITGELSEFPDPIEECMSTAQTAHKYLQQVLPIPIPNQIVRDLGILMEGELAVKELKEACDRSRLYLEQVLTRIPEGVDIPVDLQEWTDQTLETCCKALKRIDEAGHHGEFGDSGYGLGPDSGAAG